LFVGLSAQHRGDIETMRRTSSKQIAITEVLSTSAVLFLLTPLIGLWATPDLIAGLGRLGVLVAGIALMFGVAWFSHFRARTVLSLVGLMGGGVAASLTIGFLSGILTNSGLVASGIMVLLPLAIAALIWNHRCGHQQRVRWGAATLLLALIGLAFCRERTAWLALALGIGFAGWTYWRFLDAQPRWSRRIVDFLLIFAGVTLLALYGIMLFSPVLDAPVAKIPLVRTLLERLPLWRESLVLIGDYRFTGSGLNNSAMIYSTYAYLLHVPVVYHAHNLYLQIALEQGLPGLMAFLGIAIALVIALLTTYPKASIQSRIFYLAAIADLATVLTYGLLDAELYASPLMPLLFLPFGVALLLYQAHHRRRQATSQVPASWPMPDDRPFRGAGLLPLGALLLLVLWPGSLASMHANLGALIQSKAELSHFHWPEPPLQDELRLNNTMDFSRAISHYNSALAYNPNNSTAHRRLGQIALSRGDFKRAQEHLVQALTFEQQTRATRQLLGEVYAVTGHPEQAAALWQDISVEEGQLEVRHWWYEYIGARHEANLITQAVQKMK
jgi:O-antigen ligase